MTLFPHAILLLSIFEIKINEMVDINIVLVNNPMQRFLKAKQIKYSFGEIEDRFFLQGLEEVILKIPTKIGSKIILSADDFLQVEQTV